MLRPILLALIAALALPAAASADTLTVDPADANNACTRGTDNTCKTIAQAVAAAQAGDIISILKGTYAESLSIPGDLTLRGVSEVKITGANTGDVITVAGNNVKLEALAIEVPTNGGSALKVDGTGAVIEGLIAQRSNTSDVNDPVVDVTGGTAIKKSLILQNAGATGTAAIRSTGAGGVVLEDVIALSFKGPAVTISQSESNKFARSTLVSAEPSSNAVEVTSAGNSSTAKKLIMDSTAIVGGANGAGLKASSGAGSPSTAGDITIEGRHVTIAGSKSGVIADASAANGSGLLIPGPDPAGNITAKFISSIVHGASEAKKNAGLFGVTAANQSEIAYQNCDAPPATGNGKVDGTQNQQNTEDAKLFAPNSVKLRADAPVIDKGSAPLPDESATDLDGQPRSSDGNGDGTAASDIGADEFVNLAPKVLVAVTNPKPREKEAIGFFAGATDPEEKAGGGIAEYRWDFGDGTKETTKVAGVAHTYATRGSYTAQVVAVDRQGAVSNVATQQIEVVDGVFPALAITSPASGSKITVNPAPKRKSRRPLRYTLPKPKQLTISGTASDDSGIAKLEVIVRVVKRSTAIKVVKGKIVKVKPKPLAKGQCEFYSGRLLAKKACDKELWISVPVVNGKWTLTTRKGLRLPPGAYEILIRATDGSGLMSKGFTVKDKTRVDLRLK